MEMINTRNIIKLIQNTFPKSQFDVVKEEWIKDIEERYSELPPNLKYPYNELGYGTIGDSHYSIHVLTEPEEIYDPETASELKGKLIVGDDFGGECQAYDTENNWTFGLIDSGGDFESYEGVYNDFLDYLQNLCVDFK
ncbi:hypothetical protein H7U19_07545 [Hyunsoonleella sp. SJ7]|uniref:SMI1/KNR4 family protein n=1 Tax=Hyunsoonleella aquatilis TaxID=2762758 RepID=A0A923HH20_9FLAO|nr:hypothetical protein [Hyunsoonleella aquatilis]MBC3758252.1 hypothetical protein [Hyunsoonleella aquatilis]